MTKILICDLNGTIADTAIDTDEILLSYCHRHHLPIINQNEFKLMWQQRHQRRSITHWVGLNDGDYTSHLTAVERQLHQAFSPSHIKVFAGWSEVLYQLSQAGWIFAIYSNATRFFCQQVLLTNQLADYFRVIKGMEDNQALNIRPKPAPEMLPVILADLASTQVAGVDLVTDQMDKIYFIGDTHKDIEFAQNSKIHSIYATWGFGHAHTIATLHPEFSPARPIDLLQLLPI